MFCLAAPRCVPRKSEDESLPGFENTYRTETFPGTSRFLSDVLPHKELQILLPTWEGPKTPKFFSYSVTWLQKRKCIVKLSLTSLNILNNCG
jgi:hypothetical protein